VRRLTALVLVAMVIAGLNVSGLVRYPGGPLSEVDNGPLWLDIPPRRLGIGESAASEVGKQFYVVVFLENRASSDVTLEWLQVVDASAGVQSVGAYRLLPGSEAYSVAPWGTWPGADPALEPLPTTIRPAVPGAPQTMQLLVVIRPTLEGPYQFAGVRLNYRIGPFAFSTVMEPLFTSCAHAPGQPDCRDPEAI
jgi:hypothetical protein